MKSKKIIIFICLVFVSLTVSCVSESVTEGAKLENNYLQDNSNAYNRVNSDVKKLGQIKSQSTRNYDSIVVAEYVESKIVRKKNYFDEVKKTNDLSAAIGGRVHTFKVKKVVCKNEFAKPEGAELSSSAKLSFFDVDGSGFYQLYEEKKKYLLLLSALPDQSKLKDNYELDSHIIYYNPYPFSDAERNEQRVKEIYSELKGNYLSQLKNLCVE